MGFPFTHGDYVQHVSGTGDVFIVRLVDESVGEAYAERAWWNPGTGTRIINPDNWKKVEPPDVKGTDEGNK